jgi:ABC-type phosphate transport system substrate-binding protein
MSFRRFGPSLTAWDKPWSVLACTAFLLAGLASHAQAQLVVVASAKSPVSNLTADQTASLFLGKTDRLGDSTVQLIDLVDTSPFRESFYAKVTGKSPAQVKATWTRLVFSGKAQFPNQATDSAEVKKFLMSNPSALGFMEKSAVDSSVKVLFAVD